MRKEEEAEVEEEKNRKEKGKMAEKHVVGWE